MALSQTIEGMRQLLIDVLLFPVRILEDVAKILGVNPGTLIITMLAVLASFGILGAIGICVEKRKKKKEGEKQCTGQRS